MFDKKEFHYFAEMRKQAQEIYKAAIAAVQPELLIANSLQIKDRVLISGSFSYQLDQIEKIFVVSVGKAASAMAREAEKILEGKIDGGIVLTKYEHGLPLKILPVLEAGHPVSDENGRRGASAIAAIAKNASENDLIIFLLSGGASALMADLPQDIDIEEFDTLTKALLRSGADIAELNAVRKHLSTLKGGQLARMALPAKLVCLTISDVPGDSPDIIGSGPTVADNSTFGDVMEVFKKYDLLELVGASIKKRIEAGMSGTIPETPKPGDPALANAEFEIIGNNKLALKAAVEKAVSLGFHVIQDEAELSGEAADIAIEYLEKIRGYSGLVPVCILAGGETTVTVTGSGKGGRNQQLALAAVVQLMQYPDKSSGITLLAGATDGTDGPTDASGAFADEEIISKLITADIHPESWLKNNDAYHFFKDYDGLLITGPTQTNVMDILIVIRES